jgi:hypothetical protein
MKPKGSLLCSQKPAANPCPETKNLVHILLPYFFMDER